MLTDKALLKCAYYCIEFRCCEQCPLFGEFSDAEECAQFLRKEIKETMDKSSKSSESGF